MATGIFGSSAHGNAPAASDIDVLVEMEKPTFDAYMDLKFILEDLSGCNVDFVLADSVEAARLRPIILQEVVYSSLILAIYR